MNNLDIIDSTHTFFEDKIRLANLSNFINELNVKEFDKGSRRITNLYYKLLGLDGLINFNEIITLEELNAEFRSKPRNLYNSYCNFYGNNKEYNHDKSLLDVHYRGELKGIDKEINEKIFNEGANSPFYEFRRIMDHIHVGKLHDGRAFLSINPYIKYENMNIMNSDKKLEESIQLLIKSTLFKNSKSLSVTEKRAESLLIKMNNLKNTFEVKIFPSIYCGDLGKSIVIIDNE